MIPDVKTGAVFYSVDNKPRNFRVDPKGLAHLLRILRSNIYSNPKRIIVQEYANNARDAHVEAGIRDRKIQITAPTQLNPYLKIRDFGFGISPERVEDIFLSYGASTKQETNDQIGGFGIGGKSAFAYCDAFEITTIYNGIKYTYAPHIDESQIGDMPLIAEEPTEEPSGTEISIHIKDEDINDIVQNIAIVTEYWDNRPEIVGGSVYYTDRKVYFAQDNWKLMRKSGVWDSSAILYCIEGIPYYFNIPSSDPRLTEDIKSLLQSPLVIHLNTADVNINANRESLVCDSKTLNSIFRNLHEIRVSFRNHVVSSFEKCDNLKELFELRSLFKSMNLEKIVGTFVWRGVTISGSFIDIPEHIGSVSICEMNDKGRIKVKQYSKTIDFSSKCEATTIFLSYESNFDSIRRLRVRNAMESLGIKKCQVVFLSNPIDNDRLKPYGVEYFDWINLSDYENKNLNSVRYRESKATGIRRPICKIFQFNRKFETISAKAQWDRIEDADLSEFEGVYVELEGGMSTYSASVLQTVKDRLEIEIYGIPKNSMKHVIANPDMTSLVEYVNSMKPDLEEWIADNKNYVDLYNEGREYALDMQYHYCDIASILENDRVSNSSVEIDEWVNISKDSNLFIVRKNVPRILRKYDAILMFLSLPRMENVAEVNRLEDAYKKVLKKYPMLDIILSGYSNVKKSPELFEHVRESVISHILYINNKVLEAEVENMEVA